MNTSPRNRRGYSYGYRRKTKLSARESVLAAWRGVDVTPLAIARKDSARSLGDMVDQVMKEAGLDRKRGEAEIVKVWNNLLDPLVTEHAQPDKVAKGTLFVNVDSSVWLDEIVRYRRKEILEQLQNSFGRTVIQRISFRIG
jgi:predicted nucleic acid-binding Zn ribbon protein